MDVSKIPVIDTHEHIDNIYRWNPEDVGLLHVLMENHYLVADIVAADPANAGKSFTEPGISPRYDLDQAKGKLSSAEYEKAVRWFIERLPLVAHTSDWKSEWFGLRDLYGLKDPLITEKNWSAIDKRIRKRYENRDKWYLEIFDRARVKTLFWCYGEPKLKGSSRAVIHHNDFIWRECGDIRDTASLADAFNRFMDGEIQKHNPVSLKIGSAYNRDINFIKRTLEEVDAALRKAEPKTCFAQIPEVSDFIHQLMAELSARTGIPVQIHTGILAGNTLMNPLTATYASRADAFFARNPGTRFDIFHGSFPQWGEAVAIARRFPNVWLNTCWVPTLSESMCQAMLNAALDSVPVNKIMWGGDSHSPEMAYGVLKLFRGIVGRVVSSRGADAKLAREAAEWILWRSAAELYKLSVD